MGAVRHAKGVNLVDLVKALRRLEKAGSSAPFSASDRALFDQRILLSSWYPFEDFRRLLRLTHERVFGGTPRAAEQMGEYAAEAALQGVHRAFLRQGDAYATVRALERVWSTHFDFGEVEVTRDVPRVEITVHGYRDMESVHGHLLVGWIRRAAQLAGVLAPRAEIRHAPWLDDRDYRLVLHLES